jgi:integrase
MPTLFRRSNGIYYVLIRAGEKIRWISTGERVKTLALGKLVEILRDDSTQSKPASKLTPETPQLFSAFIREFRIYADANYAAKTAHLYDVTLKRFLTHVGDKAVMEFSARDADSYKIARSKVVSPVSVSIELRTLRAAFYTAQRWGRINVNPFKGVGLPRIAETQPIYLSQDDLQKLLAQLRHDWMKDVVIFACSTGLRRGELVNLRWEDVQLQEGMIRVQSNGTFRTKSGRLRWVPLNATALQVLQNRLQLRKGDYVFARRGFKIDTGLVTHLFKRAVRAAGVNSAIHFHSLRHTFATWLVQSGASIYDIQKLLGHSSIKVTQIYSHLGSEQLRRTVGLIQIQDPSMAADIPDSSR